MNDADAQLRIARLALDWFEQSLDWPPGERLSRLATLDVEDTALAVEVRRLLDMHTRAEAVLPTEFSPVDMVLPRRPPPERVGQYALRECLGSGGMGEVHRGERDDGLFEHSVAIKLLRNGLDSASARDRFDAERRLLARLRHPHIAQIYDGGATSDGRPYLVMELVSGVRVDEYCMAQAPGREQILALFSNICRAVQFAHQQLVVHADLKPTNVLVTREGEPKLVDFGIARALDLPVPQVDTGERQRPPLTLAYASPERLAGAEPRVADDVFALGVMLRQLLTGSLADPIEPAHDASLDPDLAAIAMRASDPDAARRYATAGALADDIGNFLASRPVSARAATAGYRLRKYVRRNALVVALGSAAIVAILGGLLGTSLQYRRADAARVRTVRHFDQVRSLAQYMLFDMNEKLRLTPGTLDIRQQVVDVGQHYLGQLAVDEDAPLDVQLDVVRGYVQLAALWGEPRTANLGDRPRAIEALRRADAIARRLDTRHPGTAARQELIRVNLALLRLSIFADGMTAEVKARLAGARSLIDTLRPDADAMLLDAQWWIAAADAANWQERYDDGMLHAEHAQRLLSDPLLAAMQDFAIERLRFLSRQVHAEALFYSKGELASLGEYRELMARAEAILKRFPDDPNATRLMIDAQYDLSTTLIAAGKPAEAVEVIAASLELTGESMRREPHDLAAVRGDGVMRGAYAQALVHVHRDAEAIRVAAGLVDQRREVLARSAGDYLAQRDYQNALIIQAGIYDRLGRKDEACRIYQDAADFMRSPEHRQLAKMDETTQLKVATDGIARSCRAAAPAARQP
jgi:tetratricopeptide (TPR) repeat protein